MMNFMLVRSVLNYKSPQLSLCTSLKQKSNLLIKHSLLPSYTNIAMPYTQMALLGSDHGISIWTDGAVRDLVIQGHSTDF